MCKWERMMGEDNWWDQHHLVNTAQAEQERIARWTNSSTLASPAHALLWYPRPSHHTRQHAKNARTALFNSAKCCDSSHACTYTHQKYPVHFKSEEGENVGFIEWRLCCTADS